MHWIHLRSVLKMSRQKGRSLCELTDYKQRKQGTPCHQSICHVVSPGCSFQANQNILVIVLMTNKSHSSGTPAVKKSSKLLQTLYFSVS